MATPFTIEAKGSSSPVQQAASRGIENRLQSMGQGVEPEVTGGNSVSELLALATKRILQEGPTTEVTAAIQGFLMFLQKIAGQGQGLPTQASPGLADRGGVGAPPQGGPVGPPAGVPGPPPGGAIPGQPLA